MSISALKAAPASADAAPTPSATPKPVPATDIRRRLLGYLLPHKKPLILGLICGTLAGAVEVGVAKQLKDFVDGLAPGQPNALTGIAFICGLVVVLYAVLGLLKYGQNVLLSTVAQYLGLDLRRDIYAHLQKQSLGFFHQRRTGALMSTLTGDVPKLQNAATMLKDAIVSPINAVFFLGSMFYVSWKLSVFVLIAVPIMALVIQRMTRRLRALSLQTQNRIADVAAVMEETLAAPRIVRAFVAEDRELIRFDQAGRRAVETQLRAVRRSAQLGPTVDLIGATGIAATLLFGGYLVIHSRMTSGDLLAYLLLVSKVANSVNGIGTLKSGWEDMMGAADRIFSGVMDIQPEIADAPNAAALPPVTGRIAFENVSFAYSPDKPVLRNIQLTIEPGQVVAFVGETGAGKSTMADLVPRFYDPTSGRITVDGHDIRGVTLHSLRSQIGIVPQESILFSGTLRENLVYGRPSATDDEVRAAARATNIAEFIESLPDGYETLVGERGSTLSGGQRQRVAIARALIANPRILILDEATSALDAKTEALVQAALDTLMEGRTTLIIAHRLSTIQNADRIVVLAHGEIAEMGTHAELLAHDGIYARLYATQAKQKEAVRE